MKKVFLLGIIMGLCLCGCGGADGTLTTSMVTATIDKLILDSDVVLWVDADGAPATACGASSPAVPPSDEINVTIVSKANLNTGTMGLPIRIDSATVSYIPVSPATPPMSSVTQIIGVTIANGSTAIVPVRVATQEQKISLIPILSCNSTIYNYNTTITFNITEIGTDKNTTINSSLQLRFADYIDE